MESVRLLQTRLDGIKKRHDELEPGAPAESDIVEEGRLTPVEGGITRSRSTITMVSDSPRPISATKAERLLGLGFGAEIEDGGKRIGKATSWLKKSFGKQKKRKAAGGADSPSSEGSPSTLYPSPELGSSRDSKESPRLGKYIPALPSPASRSSNEFSNGSGSPTENTRKGRPPTILTTSPAISTSPASNGFAFEFELPTVSPRSDTFDPTPTPSSPRRNSQPPSPHQPQSPHMSKSFSKRSSLLPPQTASALEAAVSPRVSVLEPVSEEGYDRRLHAYAIRMLAELEDAQKEVSVVEAWEK